MVMIIETLLRSVGDCVLMVILSFNYSLTKLIFQLLFCQCVKVFLKLNMDFR